MHFSPQTFTFHDHSKALQVRIKVTPETMTIAECNKKGICFVQYIIHFSKFKYSIEWNLNQNGQLIGGSINKYSNSITQFVGQTSQLLEFQQNIEGRIAFEKNQLMNLNQLQIKETQFSDILLINFQGELRILKILEESQGRNELEILKLLKTKTHPNILSLKNYWEENNQFSQYYIEIEYKSGGTLQNLVERYNGNVPKYIVKSIMMQLLEALQHLHQLNIIHRDIKFDNIVLDAQSETVYIIDFGLSIIGEQYKEQYNLIFIINNRVGTQGYIAPEIFNSYLVTFKQDIFSLGVVFHKLLFNQEVFSTFKENQKGIFNIRQGCIDSDTLELLQNMLKPDSSTRFSALDCLSSSYFLNEDNVLPSFIDKLKFKNNCKTQSLDLSIQTL